MGRWRETGFSRRSFCGGAAAVWLAGREGGLLGQLQSAASTRPDVAAIDRERILAGAERYLTQAVTPVTSLPCPRSAGTAHDYYSEADGGFTVHRDAVFALGLAVPGLAAAYLVTGEERYAERAVTQLRAWFVEAGTRMTPRLDYGQVVAGKGGQFAGILETLPLVEVAQAVPVLMGSAAFAEGDRKAVIAWFAEYLQWLTEPQDSGPRLGALARDRKDHHGMSWMLQAAAYTLLTAPAGSGAKGETGAMTELRHRFKTVTLRAQVSAAGSFPHELPSETPYRDSLFCLDMMACVCELLSTRFDSAWTYELQDGPSMRSAIAYHFPLIADRTKWPYRADIAHFKELPGRRVSLLLAARAYQRPEYAALWKTLPVDLEGAEVGRTIPVHQPVLWVRKIARV